MRYVTFAAILSFVFSSLLANAALAQEQTRALVEIGLTVDVRYDYYAVEGTAAREILNSMQRNGPSDGDESFFAITSAQSGFRYLPVETPQGCTLDEIGVQTEITVTLPKWVDVKSATPALQETWEHFMSRLLQHERWHIDASKTAAEEFYAVLFDLQQPTCAQLDSHAKRMIQNISDRSARQNVEYDRDTDHGRLEGVVWPVM